MSPFELATVFISLVAIIGWLNTKWIRLPPSVAMLAVGAFGSVLVIAARQLPPVSSAAHALSHVLKQVNFPETVVGYMLAFLLFAGAMQVDLEELRRRYVAVLSLATLGVLASTVIVGVWRVGDGHGAAPAGQSALGSGVRCADQPHRSRGGADNGEDGRALRRPAGDAAG